MAYDPEETVYVGKELLRAGADPSIRGMWVKHLDLTTATIGRGPDTKEWLAPDEIASKLGKKKLAKLLIMPRRQIDVEETLLKQEEERRHQQESTQLWCGGGNCAHSIRTLWKATSPVARRVLYLLVLLFLLFLFCYFILDHAIMAGGCGSAMFLTMLFFIVMRREQKWIPLKDQNKKFKQKKQRERTEERRKLKWGERQGEDGGAATGRKKKNQ